jgi:hypothetical protein
VGVGGAAVSGVGGKELAGDIGVGVEAEVEGVRVNGGGGSPGGGRVEGEGEGVVVGEHGAEHAMRR